MSMQAMLAAVGGTKPNKIYVDDVFTALTRTGTGADATATTNIDMTKGYLLWSKGRSGATDHAVYDSLRGVTLDLATNQTAAQTTQATGLKAVSATGHSVGALAKMNTSGATYVDFVFRKASKFFDVVTWTGDGVAGRQIPHNLGIAPGMIVVKCVSATGHWAVYHKNIGATKYLLLSLTQAENALQGVWNNTEPTSSVFTIGDNAIVNTAGVTYVAYVFAHDPSADGLIQCGSFATDAAGNVTGNGNVTLGWEPQWLLVKRTDAIQDWKIVDVSREWSVTAWAALFPNLTSAESVNSSTVFAPTATGFKNLGTSSPLTSNSTYIYMAIRRPNKPPTSGTQVFAPAMANSSVVSGAVRWTANYPVDLFIQKGRTVGSDGYVLDRLRGNPWLGTSTTDAEAASVYRFDNATGVAVDSTSNFNDRIGWMFRRAPGFMDVVCYTGTGAVTSVGHSLGVAPELYIMKCRSIVNSWMVGSTKLENTEYLSLNTTSAKTTNSLSMFNSTYPTSTELTFGNHAAVNASGATLVAYLFATLPGISKVFSYTGNGTSQVVPCGFSNGARFVLVKRTNAAGDWFVWDTVRGIVAGNDPYLSFNTTMGEVTTDDSIDPDASGFIVNQLAATNINVNGATYIGLAIA